MPNKLNGTPGQLIAHCYLHSRKKSIFGGIMVGGHRTIAPLPYVLANQEIFFLIRKFSSIRTKFGDRNTKFWRILGQNGNFEHS